MVQSKTFQSNFYLRASEFIKNKETKLKEQRDIKIKNEIPSDCTFHPIINKY